MLLNKGTGVNLERPVRLSTGYKDLIKVPVLQAGSCEVSVCFIGDRHLGHRRSYRRQSRGKRRNRS